MDICFESEFTHMRLHIVQAHIKTSQHTRELLIADSISCTGGIKPSRSWVQEIIVMKIVLDPICKLCITFLGGQKPLALLLKVRCLSLDRLERFGQAG
jgi:hypothetical protein